MKNSPIYPSYLIGDYGGYEFDPHVDFAQFLEEARQHARQMNLQSSLAHPDPEDAGKRRVGEAKKSKKSWKNSLFKWWKAEKKSTSTRDQADSSHIVNPKKGHVSGPIHGSGREVDTRHRRQTSGPITNLLNPIKRVETDIPYMCLDQLNHSHGVNAYGPVYLVT